MIQCLEDALGVKARKQFLSEQPGDLPQTWADLHKAESLIGYKPLVPFELGVQRFAEWVLSNRSSQTAGSR